MRSIPSISVRRPSRLRLAMYGVIVLMLGSSTVFAANNSTFNQIINTGTLATDIRDNNRTPVASPSVVFSPVTLSFSCQPSSGTFGTNTQRIYADNPDASDSGFTLSLAATSGPTTLWQNSGSSQNYDFNDPTTAGCADGGDADSRPGQLAVSPSGATITADCTVCTNTGLSLGSNTAYSQGTTDSITLLTAAAASADIGRWYLTNIGLAQQIPAEQAADSYTLNLTLTIAP